MTMGGVAEAKAPAETAQAGRKEPISSPPRGEVVDLTGDASPAAPDAEPSTNGATAPAPQNTHTYPSDPSAEQPEPGTGAAPPPRVRTGKRPAAEPSTSSAPSHSADPDVVESPPKKPRAAKAQAQAQAPTAAAAAKKKAAPLSTSQFTKLLGDIMSASGGVMHVTYVPKLKDIADHAGSWGQRVAILTTLTRSPQPVQAEFVAQSGLLTLQQWFKEAVDGDRDQSLEALLTTLAAIPVTLAALQKPCELGKMVGNLRKDARFASLHGKAKAIVGKWKAVVAAAPAAEPVASAAAAAAAAADKAEAAAAEVKAATAKATAAAETKAAAAKVAAAAAAAAAPPSASAALPKRRLGDDADLFGAADKRRKDAAVAKQQQHTDTVKPAPPAAAKSAAAAAKPPPGPAVPSTAGAPKGKSSSSLFGGPSSLSLFSSGSSMGATPLMTAGARAAQRARDAAARVPSPPPPDRSKPKPKKVSWVEDPSLEAVRWFLRADPPSAAQRDADENSAAAAAPPSPPRFASAAKKEHLLEAQALRSHREAENVSRSELVERLAAMKTEIKWASPPDMAMPELQHPVAAGEESTEVTAGPARRARSAPAVYATPDAIPPCPTEPLDPRDRGLYPSREPPRRIPLVQVTQQAQQTQQGPPPIPGYGPPPPQHQVPGYGPPPPQQHQAYPPYGQPPPHQQHQPYQHGPGPSYGAPPPPQQQQQQHAPPLQGYGAPPGAAPGLPNAAMLSQLTQLVSSGVLQTGAPASAPPPQHQPMAPGGPPAYPGGPPPPHGHGHYAPPAPHPQQGHYQPPHGGAPLPQPPHLQQQQRDRAPRPPMPKMPPGMRPMLGLHGRPQQAPPPAPAQQAPPPGGYGAPQAGPPQQNGAAVYHPGIHKVLEPRGKSRTPCRHFMTPAGCRMGDACRFSHEPNAGRPGAYGGRY